MGIMNRGMVYALWDYAGENPDELAFHEGDCMTIVRREDEDETDWWWARMGDTEGYIPRNLLGVSHESEPVALKQYLECFLMFCYLAAVPQNKAKTEDPGLKHKHPCTFNSATHTHTCIKHSNKHTLALKELTRRTLLKRRNEHTPDHMKDWSMNSGTFLCSYNRNILTLSLLSFSASFLCFCCYFYYRVKLFLKWQAQTMGYKWNKQYFCCLFFFLTSSALPLELLGRLIFVTHSRTSIASAECECKTTRLLKTPHRDNPSRLALSDNAHACVCVCTSGVELRSQCHSCRMFSLW